MTKEYTNDPLMGRIDLVIRSKYTPEQAIKDLNECDDVIKDIEKNITDEKKKRYMMAHAYLHKRYIYRSMENKKMVKEMYDIVKKINPNETQLIEPWEETPSK